MRYRKSRELLARARRSQAGGVSSNVRAAESPTPLFFTGGAGSHLTDVDGNDYVDYVLGQGPNIFGHAPDWLNEAVSEAIASGVTFAGQHELEITVAEKLRELIPNADLVRFASSGTEVVQAALRLARAYTGRSKFIKFEGHYHGWADSVSFNTTLADASAAGERESPERVAMSLGMPESVAADVIVLPWNDLEVVRDALETQDHDVAAILTEPIMCNTNCIMPKPGYLEGLRELCDRHGVALIFDEVITGFRVAAGGAQQTSGVVADISTYAKAMAGGFPVAMFAGKADIMSPLADGSALHGGTVNGNIVSLAAANACLDRLASEDAAAIERLYGAGEALMEGLRGLCDKHEIPALIQGPGPMFAMTFTDADTISDWRDHAIRADTDAYRRFCDGMLERGVRLIARGIWFVSTEHDAADVARTLEAADEVLATLYDEG